MTQQATVECVASPAAAPARRRRRTGQRIVRVGVVLALLLGLLYIALPWWLPTALVRRHIVKDIAEQTGLAASVGDIELSWGRGIILRDLRINSPDYAEHRPMIHVRHLAADFSPLDLLTGRLEWLEVTGLEATVESVDGRLNLDALRRLEADIETRRLAVREARVVFAAADSSVTLNVHDFQLVRGRAGRIDRLSCTGSLAQPDGVAPFSLQLLGEADSADAAEAAVVRLEVDGVELSHLPLPAADFPLKALAGRCRGRLGFMLDTHGKVDGLELDLRAVGLRVTPVHGPSLAPAGDAWLRIAAGYDAFSDRIDIHDASIRLPGADLQVSASLYSDILAGYWQAVNTAEIRGTIYPEPLRAMLTGGEDVVDGLDLRGPLQITAAASRDQLDGRLALNLAVGAGQAELRQAGRLLKPAGLETGLQLQVAVDPRQRQLKLKQLSLLLGKNELTAEAGSLTDIAAVIRQLRRRDKPISEADLLEVLSHASIRGTLRLCDARVLAPLLDLDEEQAATTGELRGTWSLTRGDPCWLRVGIESPPGSELAIGKLFRKPADQPLRLDLTAGLHADEAAIRQLQLDLTAGEGQFSIRDGYAEFAGHDDPKESTLRAPLEITGIEHVLAMFPAACDADGPMASGSMTGDVLARQQSEDGSMAMTLDAGRLAIRVGSSFRKSYGSPLGVAAMLRRSGSSKETLLTAEASSDELQVGLELLVDDAGEQRASASLTVGDLSRLPVACPALAEALGDATLGGSVTVTADRERRSGPVKIAATGKQLAFRRGEGTDAIVMEGGAFSVNASLQDDPTDPDRLNVTLAPSTFSIPALQVEPLTGQLLLRKRGSDLRQPSDALAAIESAKLDFIVYALPSKIIEITPPDARKAARQLGVGGMLKTTGRLEIDAEGLVGSMKVDGDELTFDSPELTKAEGLPGSAEVLLSRSRGAKAPVVLEQLRAKLAGMSLSAEGTLPAIEGGGPTKLNVTLDVPAAADVLAIVPKLRDDGWSKMSGGLHAQALWRASEEQPAGRIEQLELKAKSFDGILRETPVRVDGMVQLSGLANHDNNPQLASFRTSDLEFRAGETHGWLIADMTDPLSRPRGEAHVLFETLNDRELSEWLRGEPKQKSAGDLTEADAAHLERRATETIETLRKLLAGADATLRVTARQYTAYDVNVDQSYEVRNMHLRADARDGQLSLTYDAGLNGGTMHQEMTTRLTQDRPRVHRSTTQREIHATDAIRPRISITFPGNSVHGLFTRKEDVELSLQQMLANAMDPRYRITLVGEAEMIATDGVVVGRAAPQFVTRIFPGLNLTRYRYDRMTGYTTFLPDGSQENETIFTGLYDVYMEGTTDRDKLARYTLGLVLLPTRVSHDWHRDWKQGRFPILKVKGTIRDGRLIDEAVSYPWPNETLFEIFLQNNIVYRAWLNFKSRPQAETLTP